MTESVVVLGSAVLAVGCAGWAALLAMVQEAPVVSRSLGGPPARAGRAVPFERALQVSRLALVLVAAAAAAFAVAWWLQPTPQAFLRAVVTVAFLHIFTDTLPRAVGVLFPQLAAVAVPLARGSLTPFRPLLGLVASVERGTEFLFPSKAVRRADGGKGERDMLAGVMSLSETTVEEIMTPRLDIIAIDAAADWPAVAEQVRRSEHARLPVYRGDLDTIEGILYAKDLMPAVGGMAPPPTTWHEFVRPAPFVPESKSLAAQLRDFKRGRAHIAIVVDEFGGTSGLVTLEDVLEEVVGEIYGEYDEEERPPIVSEGVDKFWVDGTVTLDTLSEALHVEITHDDVTTVGGLVYSELGRVPHPGEELRIGDFRVVVENVVRRRIHRVYFERRSQGEDGGSTTS